MRAIDTGNTIWAAMRGEAPRFPWASTAGREDGGAERAEGGAGAPGRVFEHFGALGLQHMGALEALESGSLTPEAVVALLQSRLGSLDAQITDRMNEIQGRAADAMDLSGRLEKLRALESHIQAQGKKGKLSKDAEITLADGSTVTAEALLEQLGLQTLIKSNRISSEALGPQIEIVSARYKEINRENEQGMIELQSLTQQRQQVISLSTQLLSSIHQPLNQIINNIGR